MANTGSALSTQWFEDLSIILNNYSSNFSVFLFVLFYGCENEACYMTCSKPENQRDILGNTHISEQTPRTMSPGWKYAALSSPLMTEVPGIVLYLQGDGGCRKRVPVNPVSFFLQLIIFSTLHWDGPQL